MGHKKRYNFKTETTYWIIGNECLKFQECCFSLFIHMCEQIILVTSSVLIILYSTNVAGIQTFNFFVAHSLCQILPYSLHE